jgi:thymidylate synthase ThyX
MKQRDIYLLNPKEFSPEVIAVAFAKTSRSPESFREITIGLTDEKSAEFNEKWVVGYGHASVAEHAVLHLAIENVSRLAVESIESNRLASYTEKSTRYQVFDRDAFYTPASIASSKHAKLYEDTIHLLYDTYFDSIGPVRAIIHQKYPRKADESEKKYEGRIRSKWIDNCRYLLPMATLANLGMTANARVLEHAITKMLSHPLAEAREIGEGMLRVSRAEVPTLLKYAAVSEYVAKEFRNAVNSGQIPDASGSNESVKLIDYDRDAEIKFVAAYVYRGSEASYAEELARARALSSDDRAKIIDTALSGRGEFDAPLRELEHTNLMVECVMDQGAYFDVKRHRMMTQTAQPLTVDLGYAMPKVFTDAGYPDRYQRAMQTAIDAFKILRAEFPVEAAYVVPNAFNRRVLMTMNLREAFHFCYLRGGPTGHFAYRRIAIKLYEVLREIYPALAAYMRCDKYPPSSEIEREFFESV